MGARMRALDWTRTPLGAPERWPQSLKTIVRVMLDSRYAMWMLWGPELTFFCNDAYLPTVGMKRDWVLGARVRQGLGGDLAGHRPAHRAGADARARRPGTKALLLFLERSGFTEETYHTFSYSPVYDDDNRIAGMLCVVTEVTERVIGERRLRTLRDLARAPRRRRERGEGLPSGSSGGSAQYRLDVPFAALYLVDARRSGAAPAWPSQRNAAGGIAPERWRLSDAARPGRWRPSCTSEAAGACAFPVGIAIAAGALAGPGATRRSCCR